MSNTIQAVQPVNAQTETQPLTQAPKNTQAGTNPILPQDTVTISTTGKRFFEGNAKPPAGGAVSNTPNKQ
jgi:hypothetical protein